MLFKKLQTGTLPCEKQRKKERFSNLKQDFYILTINILQLSDLLLNKIKLLAVSAKMNWGKGFIQGNSVR